VDAAPSSIHSGSFHRPRLNSPLLITWEKGREKSSSAARGAQLQDSHVVQPGQQSVQCLCISETSITSLVRHIVSLKPLGNLSVQPPRFPPS